MKDTVYKTQRQQLRRLSKAQFSTLLLLCRLSKNLYNVALYSIRQYFFAQRKILRYESNYHAVKVNENYQALNTDIAQQTMKVADRSFRSFFNLIKKAPAGEYRFQNLGLPNYLDKDGYFSLIMPRIRLKDGKWQVPMSHEFKKEHVQIEIAFPPNFDLDTIKEVRIHPKYDGRFLWGRIRLPSNRRSCECQYLRSQWESILGLIIWQHVWSLMGCRYIIDGKSLKRINHQYNKRVAHLFAIAKRQEMNVTLVSNADWQFSATTGYGITSTKPLDTLSITASNTVAERWLSVIILIGCGRLTSANGTIKTSFKFHMQVSVTNFKGCTNGTESNTLSKKNPTLPKPVFSITIRFPIGWEKRRLCTEALASPSRVRGTWHPLENLRPSGRGGTSTTSW